MTPTNIAKAQAASRERGPKAPRELRVVNGRLEGPEYLTLAEVKMLFNVRRETVWAWRRRQGFPGQRVGSILRFPRDEVEAWMLREGK